MRYVVGVGNDFGSDDAVGLRVVEAVADKGPGHGFEAVLLPGNTIDLAHYLDSDTDAVLVVDAARMGRQPGDFAFFAAEDVRSLVAVDRLGSHDTDVLAVIGLASALGHALPTVTIMGIEPACVEPGDELSAAITTQFDEYVGAVLDFFANL